MLRPNSLACDMTSMGLLLMVIGSKTRLVLAKLMPAQFFLGLAGKFVDGGLNFAGFAFVDGFGHGRVVNELPQV